MKTSIATVSISGNLPEKLEAIANAGFDGIEIFEQDFIAYDGSPRRPDFCKTADRCDRRIAGFDGLGEIHRNPKRKNASSRPICRAAQMRCSSPESTIRRVYAECYLAPAYRSLKSGT